MKRWSNFFVFFVIQLASYSVVVFNMRVIAQGSYPLSILSDMLYCSMNYFIIRKIAKSEEDTYGFAGYVVGGMCGTAIGILSSKFMTGQ